MHPPPAARPTAIIRVAIWAGNRLGHEAQILLRTALAHLASPARAEQPIKSRLVPGGVMRGGAGMRKND